MDEFLPDNTVSHPKQQHSSQWNCELGTILKKFIAYLKVMYMHMNDKPEEKPQKPQHG